MKPHVEFFGEGEHSFDLTKVEIILELERKTGAGIGALCSRVFAGHFSHTDIIETIRLALIGGGTSPERALELVNTYVPARPFVRAQSLAVNILQARFFGDQSADDNQDAA